MSDGLARVDRTTDAEDVVSRIAAANGPSERLDSPGMDADATRHRTIFFEVMADAGIDDQLAVALYESERDHRRNLWAEDAGVVLTELKARGFGIGIVSDIHFDIRTAFAEHGIAGLIDAFSLSYEVGAQKPSARIYQHALDSLGSPASETLMVGDRAVPDGGAVDHGLTVLLLPALQRPSDLRLGSVRDLAVGGR
ncbi:HAD family hydrolase [Microbacterium sp. CJ88]|uniref:HAD family hydrolase n=1 Tax=Microbacterium sp. CJ88 TaxID=3445672 RepID=UPI003F656F7D